MYQENNNIELVGTVVNEPKYDHETYNEKFYKLELETKRISGYSDVLPVLISDKQFNINEIKVGDRINIEGQLRTFNLHETDKNRLILNVFAMDVIDTELEYDDNQIHIEGYLCKLPTYRKTPLGREITDLLIAVNRNNGKSDYIPCICWGRNARCVTRLEVGDLISIDGRLQSRIYKKKIDDDVFEERIAYELSARNIDKIENDVVA